MKIIRAINGYFFDIEERDPILSDYLWFYGMILFNIFICLMVFLFG